MGANTNVDIIDYAFSPAAVTIHAGDSVTWIWAGSATHTSTSNTGLWDSGFLSTGSRFTNNFNASGSFPYHCNVHLSMTGTINVQTAVQSNVPPAVAITAPTNGAVFAAPWSGAIHATDSDNDGSVTNLEFLAGSNVLANIANPPANESLNVSNLAAGTYSLTAVATDNAGASSTSAAVSITVVTPSAISLSGMQRVSATSFQFRYTATPGLHYVVQRSSDLLQWTALATNTPASSPVNFTDATASAAAQFYRVALITGP